MDDSTYEEWDGSRPFNLPEEIDLRHLKQGEMIQQEAEHHAQVNDHDPPLSIGDVLSYDTDHDLLNVSVLKVCA
jgi:hypothetical protein